MRSVDRAAEIRIDLESVPDGLNVACPVGVAYVVLRHRPSQRYCVPADRFWESTFPQVEEAEVVGRAVDTDGDRIIVGRKQDHAARVSASQLERDSP